MGKIQSIARQLARDFRANQTKSEKLFWEIVRNRKFLGLKFTRQHPIFYKYNQSLRFFIADFYCAELKLVIEIDGGIHQTQANYDQIRTEVLETKKIKVIRFLNNEIESSKNKVLINLKHYIDEIKN